MLHIQPYSKKKPGKPKDPLITRQMFITLILLSPNSSIWFNTQKAINQEIS